CRRTPSTMPSSAHSMVSSVQDSRDDRSYRTSVIPDAPCGADPESRDSGFDASHRPGMTIRNVHPLNQPCASPVKEKYSPAAVSEQETISMALSSSTPLSPIVCASETTDSTSEATSTQRGQFFRRWA